MGALILNREVVDRESWNRSVAQLDIQNRYPGIQGIGWARFVSLEDRDLFIQRMRATQQQDYQYFPLGDRPHYLLIEHLSPEDWRNQRALGFDMYSEMVRRQAIDNARKTGESRLTGPVILVQETDEDVQTGSLIYVPIYRNEIHASASEAERVQHFVGTVYSPFRMSDFVQRVLGAQTLLLDIRLVDHQAPNLPLYSNPITAHKSLYEHQESLDVFGRKWTLLVSSSAEYENAVAPDEPLYTLMLGLLAALLSSMLVTSYLYFREKALHAASQSEAAIRAREQLFVNLIQHSPIAKITVDEHGLVAICNSQFAEFVGQPENLIMQQPLQRWIPTFPVDRYLNMAKALGTCILDRNCRYQISNPEQTLPVEVNISGIHHEEHYMLMLSIIDISERLRSEDQLKEVVEASPNAILLVNEEGCIEFANQQTEQLFGYSRAQLIGQNVDMLVPDDIRPRHPSLREHYFRAPVRAHIGTNRDLYAKHRSGQLIPVEIGLSALQKGDRRLVQAVLIDISARKEATRKLEQQARELVQLTRYKSEFLANMSHELRTPLNSILILSDQLRGNREGTLTSKQLFHADIIHRAGQDLLTLINDILDLAKVEAGKMTLRKSPCNLPELLNELRDAMKPVAESKGLKLSLNLNEDLPNEILTDSARLAQILRNLLSNAIKFTEIGQVSLTVLRAIRSQHDNSDSIEFRVLDTGIGIAPDKIEEIFNAFIQVDSSTQKKGGGTGLGLSISRQLAKLFGGDIRVESVPGKGSVFTLQLPLETTTASAHSHEATTVDPTSLADSPATIPNILIVEDDDIFATMLMRTAQQFGLTGTHASNGATALRLLNTTSFSGVLLDLLLPDMSGWQVLRAIQANPNYESIPVQILSCLPEPHDWFDEKVTYLLKPLNRDSLHRVFERLQPLQPKGKPTVLLVEDVDHEREHYATLMQEMGCHVIASASASEAKARYLERSFDILVLDLRLPDASGYELLQQFNQIRRLKDTAVIIHTGAVLSETQVHLLEQFSSVVVHKAGSDTKELHAALQPFFETMSKKSASPLQQSASESSPPETTGKPASTVTPDNALPRVLVVDDDTRNIISLEAMLSDYALQLFSVNSGIDALKLLVHQQVDLILMDIAMAGMDGYATIEAIKSQRLSNASIIALTAHAMKGDREHCIAAGADDYLAKPVNRKLIVETMSRYIELNLLTKAAG